MGQTDESFGLGHLLEQHARLFPEKPSFIVPEHKDDREQTWSYASLLDSVRRLSTWLSARKLKGKRVLLVSENTIQFVVTFLACNYAGVIPVPVPYAKGAKQVTRLATIMKSADAAAILCTADTASMLQKAFLEYQLPATIEILPDVHEMAISNDMTIDGVTGVVSQPDDILFLQYTSGATSRPKGVVVTLGNLLHNQALIQKVFGCDSHSVIFSWLPFHHDMGLIGNVLHTIYTGCTCILLSPYDFMQKPVRWLKGISRYKATHSGGPNFAYDLCVDKITAEEAAGLDLSSWKVAFNGAEIVKHTTIQRFTRRFEDAGFKANAFFPCYGLAEATLLVTGVKDPAAPAILSHKHRSIVSSGRTPEGMYVRIIAPENGRQCDEMEEGEICIAGDSVTSGYWGQDSGDLFHIQEGKKWLRTGDLGLFYHQELYVTGRKKEMIIVRGRNYYPYDIEQAVSECDGAIHPNGVAAFGMRGIEEQVVLIVEIKREALKDVDAEKLIYAIDAAVSGSSDVNPYDIVLTTPLGIPRTTSGKLQRVACEEGYRNGTFTVIASKLSFSKQTPEGEDNTSLVDRVLHTADQEAIGDYLLDLMRSRLHLDSARLRECGNELTAMGLDSLRATELINSINRQLKVNVDMIEVLSDNTLSGLIRIIEHQLWLKTEVMPGKEIII